MSTLVICQSCGKLNRVDLSKTASKTPVCGLCQKKLPIHNGIQELNTSGLEKLIASSELPIVVDFWAPWCGPCRAFAPTFEASAQKNASKIQHVKINTEAHPDAGQKFHIRGIPTLVVFKDGVESTRQSGAMPATYFDQFLTQWTSK